MLLKLNTLLVVSVSLLCAASAAGQTSETTLDLKFRDANRAYSEGRYAEALANYQQLVKLAGTSAELYYNLGCAAFKVGSVGVAVANFHRAARLAPRDDDIRTNLEFVESLTSAEEQSDKTEENPVFSLPARIIFYFTARELALLQFAALVLFTVAATVFASGVGRQTGKIILPVAAVGLFILLVNGTALGIHLYRDHSVTQAVVVLPDCEALSGPGEENTRVLVLPEGTLVRVREKRGGWALVSLPSGRSGWLRDDKLEEI